jgi:hypothetical protein
MRTRSARHASYQFDPVWGDYRQTTVTNRRVVLTLPIVHVHGMPRASGRHARLPLWLNRTPRKRLTLLSPRSHRTQRTTRASSGQPWTGRWRSPPADPITKTAAVRRLGLTVRRRTAANFVAGAADKTVQSRGGVNRPIEGSAWPGLPRRLPRVLGCSKFTSDGSFWYAQSATIVR